MLASIVRLLSLSGGTLIFLIGMGKIDCTTMVTCSSEKPCHL